MSKLPLIAFCMSLILAVPSSLGADDTKTNSDVEKVIEIGRESNKVMDHLDFLVNRIGPRLTSSDKLQSACEWTRDQFEAFGLENARLYEWGEFPVGFNRGPWFGKMTEPREMNLEFITPAWTAGTQGVVSGPALLSPKNEEEFEAIKDQLKGAWVLAGSQRRGGNRTAARALATKINEAGIAGTIRPTRDHLILTFGSSGRVSWDNLPTTCSVTLLKSQYDEIAKLLGDGEKVSLQFDIRNHFKKGPIKLYNVIADIPGTEFPDEYVIVGGHIDSWDGATGTCDNGTGVATTMEAARLLVAAGVKPRRTIRFMLWSGEEQGLLGSFAYVRQNTEEMARISAVLVHDMGTQYLSGISATEAVFPDFEKIFAPAVSLNEKLPFAVSKVRGLRGGGSDHVPFLRAGVPAFFWAQAGDANYRHVHHTQFDTFDAAVPEYQKHSSIIAAIGALGIANLDHKLSRENLTAPSLFSRNRASRTIGVELDKLTVKEILDGTVAAKLDIKVGDSFAKVDDTEIKDRRSLLQAIQGGKAKKKITLKRGDESVVVEVDLSGQPNKFAGTRRIMGVQLDGLTILSVTNGSLAKLAGVKQNDQIVKVDGKDVADVDAMQEILQGGNAKKKISFKRGDKEVELEFDWTAPKSGV